MGMKKTYDGCVRISDEFNGRRFVVDRSSLFDSEPYYQAAKIARLVKEAGGTNVRLSNLNGWSNQPKVVCFNAPGEAAAQRIGKQVSQRMGGRFAKWGLIIRPKWWRQIMPE